MERRSRTTVGIALALVAGLWLLVWLALAVVVPLFENARCSGIVFRAGASGPPGEPTGRPPIGGTGGLAGKVRAALRPQGSAVYCRDFADPFVGEMRWFGFAFPPKGWAFANGQTLQIGQTLTLPPIPR